MRKDTFFFFFLLSASFNDLLGMYIYINAISEGLNYKYQFCSKIGECAYVVAHMQTQEKTAVKHGGICYFR